MILGVIADDFTGATDVASMLVRAGMRTVQVIGVPAQGTQWPEADAVVVALKTRTIPAKDAVAQSLAALAALRTAGARQIYFKYCSTFDSTPKGNIGPVTDALMRALDAQITVACPAFPENARTVFKGHLFVGDVLLSDCAMRHHPLTPMTDANLVRVLQAQTSQRVGLLNYDVIEQGYDAVVAHLHHLRTQGFGIVVVDAVHNGHLLTLAEACADLPLLTGGSGLALGLPAAYQRRGWCHPDAHAADLACVNGPTAVLSGSCSEATNAQVHRWLASEWPAVAVDPLALHRGDQTAASLCSEAMAHIKKSPYTVLVYATAQPEQVQAVQAELGATRAGELVEHALAEVAKALVKDGVRRLVVAGGETSGAVVQALDVRALRIGASICPGVPWTEAQDAEGRPMLLALKSGNFGGPDFFREALARVGFAPTGVVA
jgi:uncharacterized protein YgbK (DUF1537 family)